MKLWAVSIAMLLVCPISLYALPEGESVVEGNVTFDRSQANTLKINVASDKAIIAYNSFSIGANESVYFSQPSVSSAALNRVTGNNASNISGNLNANGIIYLINPHGITIGPNANVNAAGFIASTLNMSNADFLAGRNNFFKDGANAFILNQGNIIIRNGGFVCLLSQAVENQGTIIANLGTVVVGAGEKMTLALDDLNQISVVIDEGVKEKVLGHDSAVKNSGTITANGGKVLLTAKVLNNVFDYAVNNTGIIEAKSIVNKNGVIELAGSGAPVINTGKLDAGKVKIDARDTTFINKGQIISGSESTVSASGNVAILANSLLQGGSIVAGKLITVEANDINVVLNYNPGAMEIDPVMNTSPAVIMQAPEVRVAAKQFGSSSAPLNIDADITYINRTLGDINILDSLGIGTSVLLRGPPDFGAIAYNRNTNLTLQADHVNLVGSAPTYLYGNITFSDFNCTVPDKEIYFEAGKTYTILGAFTLKGGYGQLLKLRSSVDGLQWKINPQGSRNIEFISVKDSNNINPDEIVAIRSNKEENCTNWDPTTTWTGNGTNANWSTGGNWDTGVAPPAGNDVLFDGAASPNGNKSATVNSGFNLTNTINSLTINGYTGTITLGVSLVITNGLTVSSGTLNISTYSPTAGGVTLSGGTISGTTGTLTGTSYAVESGTISAKLAGVGTAMVKTTPGTVTLSGANTFTGGLTIKEGTVVANVSNATTVSGAAGPSTSAITLGDSAGGSASLLANSTFTVSNPINLGVGAAGTLTIGNNGTTTAPTFSGAITLNGNDLTISRTGTSGAMILSGGITGTGNLTLNNAGTTSTLTLSTAAINNTGTITLQGASTGVTTISGGIGSNVTAINENSNSSALTISTNTLNMNIGGTTITNNGTALITISGGLIGAGNLTLNANSSGGITLSTTSVNNTGTITNSGTGSGTTTISAVIGTNVAGLTQNSTTSQLTLSGVNTFTTGVTIKAGTVSGTTSASAFGTGTITIGDSSGSANATLNGGFAGPFTNPITVAVGSSGTLKITNSAASTFSGAVTLNNNLTLAPTLTYLLTLSGGITGTGNLIIDGSGTTAAVTLSTNSVNMTGTITNQGTNTGTTTISGGVGANVTGITLNSTTSALTVSGAITVGASGMTLTNSSGTKILTVSGGVGGTGDLILNNNSSTADGITLSTTSVNNTGTITNSGTGSGRATISAVIGTNVTGVTQNSVTSALTLSGANTFATGVTLSAGTLNINNNSALGTGTLTISGGTIDNTSGTAKTISNAIAWNADFTFTGTGSLTQQTGAVTMNTSRQVTVSVNTLALGGIIGPASAYTLTKSGSGALTLSNANIFTGGVTLNAGTLNINNAQALGAAAGTVTINGGTINNTTAAGITTLDYPQRWAGDFTFAGTRALNLGSGTVVLDGDLTITAVASTLTVGGVIGDPGSGFGLIKAGAGTLTLSGANTYTGTTTISAGTLSASNIVVSGGSSNLGNANTAVILGDAANKGTLSYTGSSVTYTRGFTINAGGGEIDTTTNGQTLTISGGNISADGALTIGGAGNTSISSAISGSGSLTKAGTGTLTLSNTKPMPVAQV